MLVYSRKWYKTIHISFETNRLQNEGNEDEKQQ